MKLWLDDERPVPDDTWVLAKDVDEFRLALQENREPLEEVSLDYVIMGSQEDGMTAVLWMRDQEIWPIKLTVHSSGVSANALMIELAREYGPEDMEVGFWR